jgi:hypothetical protein
VASYPPIWVVGYHLTKSKKYDTVLIVMAKNGRPRIFDNPKTLQNAIDAYFEAMAENKQPLTITGLCLAIGFQSRSSFYEYEQVGEFSDIIKRARLQVENFAEKMLFSKSPTGAIFALKNYGWTDKQELLHSGNVGPDHYIVEFVDAKTSTDS